MDSSAATEIFTARSAWYRERQALSPVAGDSATEAVGVELTVVLPGTPKLHPAAERVFRHGLAELEGLLAVAPALCSENPAGYFAFFTTIGDGRTIKRRLCELEASVPWGRLWDADCLAGSRKLGRRDLGLPARRCLICVASHESCIAAKEHSLIDLRAAALRLAEACPVQEPSCQ